MTDTAYTPKLLVPDSAAMPAHMRVSHHLDVLQEMRDPAVTTALYVPRWSDTTQAAFNRLAQQRANGDGDYGTSQSYGLNDESMPGRLRSHLQQGNIQFMYTALSLDRRDEAEHVLTEVATQQLAFIETITNVCSSSRLHLLYEVINAGPQDSSYLTYKPHTPHNTAAHTDTQTHGLFTHPVGTVLVDQEGLDIPALRSAHGNYHTIRLTDLADRLWQASQASFALWRGEDSGNPQYHLIPHVPRESRRARLFAYP